MSAEGHCQPFNHWFLICCLLCWKTHLISSARKQGRDPIERWWRLLLLATSPMIGANWRSLQRAWRLEISLEAANMWFCERLPVHIPLKIREIYWYCWVGRRWVIKVQSLTFLVFWDMGAFSRSLEVYPGHVVGHKGPTLISILHTISYKPLHCHYYFLLLRAKSSRLVC